MEKNDKIILMRIIGIVLIALSIITKGLDVDNKYSYIVVVLIIIGIILLCLSSRKQVDDKNKDNDIEQNKKYCSNCGNELNINADFCLNCGVKNNKINEDTKICKYCKSSISTDATICPYCRKTLNFSIGRVIIGVIIGLFIISLIRVPNISTNNSSTENTKDYITLSEFNKIESGMSYEEVKNIIGSEGTVMSESNVYNNHTIIYYWYGRNNISNANFTFVNDKLINKTQIGLE